MCFTSSESGPSNSLSRKRSYRRQHIRVPRLSRWRRLRKKKMVEADDMERKNLKLYMENQSILKQNEALRNKALLLHQENETLLAQLQNKFSNPQNHM
ncbi:LITTLE ZIPPER 2 [Hibiscus trionum]|uniref:LITTLE ZIPPER 2 n=1 Tax=Hibiscus trionum TaxID=183268 RepID=A0A9W7H5B2_HIBTR|nr:LITTLE ZIPPER 2 [Hibiscus trionum]